MGFLVDVQELYLLNVGLGFFSPPETVFLNMMSREKRFLTGELDLKY